MTKQPKTQGRLGQLSKVLRLRARALGQWRPQAPAQRVSPMTRFAVAQAEWNREGV